MSHNCLECGCHIDAHTCNDQGQHLELREQILNLEADLNVAQRKRQEAIADAHIWTRAENVKTVALNEAEQRIADLNDEARQLAGRVSVLEAALNTIVMATGDTPAEMRAYAIAALTRKP